ncbi:hypothetical protein V1481_02205 [Aeromonas enteropelogenes]|uniref:hypothetical protein n=1 Tax=Aeromonas enteropelogenes TaxID=29489 RepID=UPI00313663E5
MLGIWLSVAQVVISGYQPIAEQTWVQLNPEYYPLGRTPPAMFVAWHGNQFPPLAQRQKNGRWQILFPARLVPPFDLFEGEAELSKAYLARLRRIDEMAYGVAPNQGVTTAPAATLVAASPREDDALVPFIAEFSMPELTRNERALHGQDEGGEPLLAQLGMNVRTMAGAGMVLAEGMSPPSYQYDVEPAAGDGRALCHRVAAGETLWRIANQLANRIGADTYSYLLALAADNRSRLSNGIRVKTGDALYCPRAETLAQFDALSPGQRQQQFARLEQGN